MYTEYFSLKPTALKCFCCQQQNINRICLNQQAIKNDIFLLCNICCKKNDKIKKYQTNFSPIQSDLYPLSLFSMNAFQKQSFLQVPEFIEKCVNIVSKKYERIKQLLNFLDETTLIYLNLIQSTLSYQSSQNIQISLKNPTNLKQAKDSIKQLKWLIDNKQKISDTDILNKKLKQLSQRFEYEFLNGMNKVQKTIEKLIQSVNCQNIFLNSEQLKQKIKRNIKMQVEEQPKNILSFNNQNKLNSKVQEQKNHSSEKQTQNNKDKILSDKLNKQRQKQALMEQKEQLQKQPLQLINNSDILKNYYDVFKLINLFDEKIKKFDLVFKADQNQYSTIDFYQKCGHMNNIIIICKLWPSDKIIGGYSHLSFNVVEFQQTNFTEDVKDKTNSSFLFSLSQNEKFNLNKYQDTIHRYKSKLFIQFGNGLLKISHNKLCKFNILSQRFPGDQNQFEKQKEKREKQTRQKYTGTNQMWMHMKEWQVIKVQFQ